MIHSRELDVPQYNRKEEEVSFLASPTPEKARYGPTGILTSVGVTSIRKWGCDRTETPFIFVHIGKSGGGTVIKRIEASAVNYSHTQSVEQQEQHSYFQGNDDVKVRYCNSCFTNRRPTLHRTFEGTVTCQATTPLGQAIACPESIQRHTLTSKNHRGECHWNATHCRLAYFGHNLFGSEIHWLPHQMLANWWSSLQLPQPDNAAAISIPWQRLDPQQIWCDSQNTSRPKIHKVAAVDEAYEACSRPLATQVDVDARRVLLSPREEAPESWAPAYASLPVLRATVLREPFSYLMSKFFWHFPSSTRRKMNLTCDDPGLFQPELSNLQQGTRKNGWWVKEWALDYIFTICGEVALTRYTNGQATLDELERQAEENLRHSFAVVGLLEELTDFYPMLSARVQYLDLNNATHTIVKEKDRHASRKGPEARRCIQRYKDPSFQAQLLATSPELRAFRRLYNVGVQVSHSHKEELQQCPSWQQNGVGLSKSNK